MDLNKNITLLIADDEASIRNGLTTVVPWDEFGISIVGTAEDGAEAYEMIKNFHPDIVITDIRMPVIDGLELMEKVRNEKIQTNFVILSGYGDFQYAQKAIQLGAKNYFLKPVKIDELITEIRQQKSEILQSGHINSYSAYLNVKSEPKEKFLKRLLKNEFHSFEELEEEIGRLDLRLENSSYRAVVFSICDSEEMEVLDNYYPINRLMEIMGNELEQMKYEFLISGTNELLAIIHTIQQNGVKVDYHLEARKCISRVRRESTMELNVGIGSEEQKLELCSNSYKMALLGLSYSFYETRQRIYDESVICRTVPPTAANRMDYSELVYFLTTGQTEKIKEYCDTYFASLRYVEMPSPNFVRGMCIYLVTDVWKELGNKLNETENREFSQSEIVLQINTVKSWEELKSFIKDFLLEIAGKLAQTDNAPGNKLIQAAEYFIKSHMGEKILAKHVAAYVNLSDVYFTSYFKMKTGVNFRDYVIRLKMEQAKDCMMRMPDMPVAEVAAAVGYDDYRSFYRVFRQYTGVNPSDYSKRGGQR